MRFLDSHGKIGECKQVLWPGRQYSKAGRLVTFGALRQHVVLLHQSIQRAIVHGLKAFELLLNVESSIVLSLPDLKFSTKSIDLNTYTCIDGD